MSCRARRTRATTTGPYPPSIRGGKNWRKRFSVYAANETTYRPARTPNEYNSPGAVVDNWRERVSTVTSEFSVALANAKTDNGQTDVLNVRGRTKKSEYRGRGLLEKRRVFERNSRQVIYFHRSNRNVLYSRAAAANSFVFPGQRFRCAYICESQVISRQNVFTRFR